MILECTVVLTFVGNALQVCFVTVTIRYGRWLRSHARYIRRYWWTWSRFDTARLLWHIVWTANIRWVFADVIQLFLLCLPGVIALTLLVGC